MTLTTQIVPTETSDEQQEPDNLVHHTNGDNDDDDDDNVIPDTSSLPDWVATRVMPLTTTESITINEDWGDRVVLPEWQHAEEHRPKHGWKGRDLMHDVHSPVRILDYWVRYDDEKSTWPVLTGIAHFTERAESHGGYCHGGSMCSVMDDVLGWCAFFVTGTCRPWSGYTVQVQTSLQQVIPVDSYLMVRAEISHVQGRKVNVKAILMDPLKQNNNTNNDDDGNAGHVHATGEGLVILKKGILPSE